MTNFDSIKEQIWKAAKKDNRHQFDNKCNALITKAVGEWWRIGWSLCPQTIHDVIIIIKDLAKKANAAWKKSVKNGDAPCEDVSPAEGFTTCLNIIKDAIKQNKCSYKKSYDKINFNINHKYDIQFHAYEGGDTHDQIYPEWSRVHYPINATYSCSQGSICDAINRFIEFCSRKHYQDIVIESIEEK